MKAESDIMLKAAVYDPSYRRAETASYWQWSNLDLDKEWLDAAEYVNKGWPADCDLGDSRARWYGSMEGRNGSLWIYRIFAGGRDRKGREGRYFFVLARVSSPRRVLDRKLAGLFDYFDRERGLPLRTEPLDDGWRGAEPDELLSLIAKRQPDVSCGHWGVSDGGDVRRFSERSPLLRKPGREERGRPSFGRRAPGLIQAWLRCFRGGVDGFLVGLKALRKWAFICTVGALILLLVLLAREAWTKGTEGKAPNDDKRSEKREMDSTKPREDGGCVPSGVSDGDGGLEPDLEEGADQGKEEDG